MIQKTLVVNLLGGPGCNKSTSAAGIFNALKYKGINCELAAEFAKDLTWEERQETLKDQIYVFGKQYHRIYRLLDKVDVIITDSPILLSPMYDSSKRKTLLDLVISEHNSWWTYNVFLKRVKLYNPKGRNQTEAEAKVIDSKVLDFLMDNSIPFETANGNKFGEEKIVSKILMLLKYNENK